MAFARNVSADVDLRPRFELGEMFLLRSKPAATIPVSLPTPTMVRTRTRFWLTMVGMFCALAKLMLCNLMPLLAGLV